MRGEFERVNKMNPLSTAKKIKIYKKIIEDATIDCYGAYEQISGWACLLDDCVPTPCNCTIGKEKAVLEKIDMDDNCNALIGAIKLNKTKFRVPIQEVLL